MPFIADFHIHSRFSRACSRNLDLPHIAAWCQLKGIDLVSTADFTHPVWFKELVQQLEETAPGVYALKPEYENRHEVVIPPSCKRPVRFICSTEVSLIYKQGERVRRVHHLILAPNLDTVSKINAELAKRGNIHSDGRPILGLNSRELLAILLGISSDIQLIPAHAWTPHFAIFGSQSGFDSVQECFGDLAPHICALETGLSSDPAMNWRLSQNDQYALISNSDAHSMEKLGREATLLDTELTFPAILHALRHDHSRVAGTIEFFPEEGKYHADGLRSENLCLAPEETKRHGGVSPKTGKKITVGVLHRVSDLADRPYGQKPATARPYFSIIPLREVSAEVLNVGPSSKKADELYFRLLKEIGPEFYILKDAPLPAVEAVSARMAEALGKMRRGEVFVKPGYDGEYGTVRVFNPDERAPKEQMKLFS